MAFQNQNDDDGGDDDDDDDGFELGDKIPLKESAENSGRGETQTDCSTHESLEKDEAEKSEEDTLSLEKAVALLRGGECLKLKLNPNEIPIKESAENVRRGETQTDCSTHESLEKDEAEKSVEDTLSLDIAAALLRGGESLKLNPNNYYNKAVTHPIQAFHSFTTFPTEDLSEEDDLEGEHY